MPCSSLLQGRPSNGSDGGFSVPHFLEAEPASLSLKMLPASSSRPGQL
jgi:hypothetical protein